MWMIYAVNQTKIEVVGKDKQYDDRSERMELEEIADKLLG